MTTPRITSQRSEAGASHGVVLLVLRAENEDEVTKVTTFISPFRNFPATKRSAGKFPTRQIIPCVASDSNERLSSDESDDFAAFFFYTVFVV